eukprot:Blabericola_migrator_1__2612@NODE_1738_length_3895_cov_18_663009_g1123_i0_p1_GENE_NODE_1738_length_3895_cov_18_663009_g1123_i0NODE_1738_length_3895_cov_18_663009_g1123_i0_p1_ORF_typecomplete_len613_score80_12_NODE_1738_length_3895_cov_18_663009_g1123_i015333371
MPMERPVSGDTTGTRYLWHLTAVKGYLNDGGKNCEITHKMPPARCVRFAAQRYDNISLGLTLGLTCLVSIGGGHHATSSLTAGNKRSADESHTDTDIRQSKRPFVNNSYTNSVASQSQTKSSAVHAARWVELLQIGWTLDDADLIQDDSDISEDTQRLWWAFQKVRKELASPNPSHEAIRTHFTELWEHIGCFMSQPRSYLESRIFFSMTRPLMPLSQYIEKETYLELQRYFRKYRIEALLKWLISRNESKLLIPGAKLNTLMMEDIALHIQYWGHYDSPQNDDDDFIKTCFVALLHGVEDVDLYKRCLAHISLNPSDLTRYSIFRLFVILPYFIKSEAARNVSPSTASTYLLRRITCNPLLTEDNFVEKGWTLNNFNFVAETPSTQERQSTGERNIERRFFEIVYLFQKLYHYREPSKKGAVLKVLEEKTSVWMTLVRQFLTMRQDYRAIRIVVGMLPSITDVGQHLKPEVLTALQDFATRQRARALEQWLNLSNDAGLLVNGQRLRSRILTALCQAVKVHAQKKSNVVGHHILHMILCGQENTNRAEMEKHSVEGECPNNLLEQSDDSIAAVIVSQLFFKHAKLPCVDEATLERWLVALMKRQAPCSKSS